MLLNKISTVSKQLEYIGKKMLLDAETMENMQFNDVELYEITQNYIERLYIIQQHAHAITEEDENFLRRVVDASTKGKIALIKVIREKFSTTLSETKKFVETIYDSNNQQFFKDKVVWKNVIIYNKDFKLY